MAVEEPVPLKEAEKALIEILGIGKVMEVKSIKKAIEAGGIEKVESIMKKRKKRK